MENETLLSETSVSMEPNMENESSVSDNVEPTNPYATDTQVAMNNATKDVNVKTPATELSPDILRRFGNEKGEVDTFKLAKSYNELEKMISGKFDVPTTNETYDVNEIMKETEMEIVDQEQWDQFQNFAKEHKISRTAMKEILVQHANVVKSFVNHYGPPPPTVDEIKDNLREAWGSKFESTLSATSKYARANLPEAVWKQLGKSVEGVKWLNELRQREMGAQPISQDRMAYNSIPTKGEVYKLVSDPRYKAKGPEADEFRAHVRKQFELRDIAKQKGYIND